MTYVNTEIADKYQEFFNFMNQEHGLVLTIEQMDEIVFETQRLVKKLTIPVVMPRCLTCKHWQQNTFYDYEGAVNDGFCSEIGSEITIELKTGWDGGYVDSIETKSTFGCVLHNEA